MKKKPFKSVGGKPVNHGNDRRCTCRPSPWAHGKFHLLFLKGEMLRCVRAAQNADRLADLDKVNRKLAKATKPQRAAYAAAARKAAGYAKPIEHGDDRRCTCGQCPPDTDAMFWRQDEEARCERDAAAKASKAASVSKTQPRGFQRPKKGVPDGQPDAKALPVTHPAYKLAQALSDAELLAQSFHGEDRLQRTAQKIVEVANAVGRKARVPCLRFDLYFVGHGYQVDVFANGKDTDVGGCQDFGGTYAVSYVKSEFYKAILAAIDKAGRKL